MYAPSYVNIQTQIPILKGSVTMKKFLALVIAAIMLLLCGCGPNNNEFKATYLKTGYDSDTAYPVISVLHSTEERDACAAEANHEKVTEALSAYDEEFFSSKVLFVLNISMASGGYNYIVEKVYGTEEGLTFQLKQTTEGPTTADMSGMTILVEMDKSWDCKPENIKMEYQ